MSNIKIAYPGSGIADVKSFKFSGGEMQVKVPVNHFNSSEKVIV